MIKLDDIDRKLLMLLQEDAKKTTKAYANSLNLSVTAVYERIKRLERDGVISQVVALVDKQKAGFNFTAFCQVRLTQHTKEYIVRFEREVQQLCEVAACHHVSGDYDYILQIHVKDMQAYRDFMLNKLTVLHHIGSTQSSFVIKEVKHTTSLAF
ncbi:Lrp/AsnC family transcriptional regulator [Flavobacteriaceae bacterium F08102]|nr:Lrp/AsnC family transcriptional regulator [Flavobacteriaceae bacterium F08102]